MAGESLRLLEIRAEATQEFQNDRHKTAHKFEDTRNVLYEIKDSRSISKET